MTPATALELLVTLLTRTAAGSGDTIEGTLDHLTIRAIGAALEALAGQSPQAARRLQARMPILERLRFAPAPHKRA